MNTAFAVIFFLVALVGFVVMVYIVSDAWRHHRDMLGASIVLALVVLPTSLVCGVWALRLWNE